MTRNVFMNIAKIFICICFFIGIPLKAEVLSNEALYYRCYGQLTQRRPSYNNSVTQAVRNGQTDPIEACLSLLNRAQFTSNNTRIGDTNNSEVKALLSTMHRLHYSWFQMKDFPVVNSAAGSNGTKDLYDVSTPALYYTRALFHPNIPFSSVFTEPSTLEALRTNQTPTIGARSKKDVSHYVFSVFPFAPTGALLGVKAIPSRVANYAYKDVSGSFDLMKSRGGGIIGSPAYLMHNVAEPLHFRADGGLKMPRKWSRAIFNDLMCRTLPVVRIEDTAGFVVPTSKVAFRTSSSCVQCHVTMDRMAANIRNFRYFPHFPTTPPGNVRPDLATQYATDLGATALWPASSDSNYHRRPTQGRLYFRNYLGTLVDLPTNNVADLGQKLSAQNDVYICTAKRYYEYFTGISVNTGDLNGASQSTEEKEHRDRVIQLGINLKSHQQVRQLIRGIFQSPVYDKSDYGLRRIASE